MARHGSSYEHDYEEPKKPQKPKGAGTDLLVLLLLAALLVVVLVPSLRKKAMSELSFGTHTKIQMGVQVWANKDAGYYYCYGSRFYGHGSGKFMDQGDALTRGFQPELGKYCTGNKSPDSKAAAGGSSHPVRSVPVTSQQAASPAVPAHARRK